MEQLRGQGKRSESEVQGLRETIARVEAEKVVLAAQVEEEGAERVTVVASITHERDFLLRQASYVRLWPAFVFEIHECNLSP